MAITAAEFKSIMLAKGVVRNQEVSEPVNYGIPAPINVPTRMEIVNCTIPSFAIGYSALESFKARGGKIGKLTLGTNSNITHAIINDVDITEELYIEEINIGNLRIISSKPIQIAGRLSTVGIFRVNGRVGSLSHVDLSGNELLVDDCELDKIGFYRILTRELKLKNVKCPDIYLGCESNIPARMELNNVTTKSASMLYGYRHQMNFTSTTENDIVISSVVFKG